MNWRRIATHPLLWTAVAFAILPHVAGANPFGGKGGVMDIATTMLIFALFASGFNLLLGFTGVLSFGHAMFFGLGAYVTALYVKGFNVQVIAWTWKRRLEQPVGRVLLSLLIVFVWATILAGWCSAFERIYYR